MKKNRIGALFIVAILIIGGFAACDDDDVKYKGTVDLNQFHLTQAFDLWQKSNCEVTTAIKQEEANSDFSYELNLSMYQNRTPSSTATVDLIVDSDSLSKAIALIGTDSKYDKYANAMILPSQYYKLSATSLILKSGEKRSESEYLTVFSQQLTDYVQNEVEKACTFVLPISISNPSVHL